MRCRGRSGTCDGSTGDPCLFVHDQGRDNALLIECGDNGVLGAIRRASRAIKRERTST